MRLSKLLVKENFEIKKLTFLKIGGKIAKIYFPENIEEFMQVLQNEPQAKVIGNLSNTLISSDGYNGTVISTSKLANVTVKNNIITAEAGVKGPKLSQIAENNNLSGMEFMIGFPGSIGGEVYMNAGAHGQEISDIFLSAKVYDGEKFITLNKSEMKFAYRKSVCQMKNYIVLDATFELKSDANISERMKENLNFRQTHQPSLALPNCGSIFKNPENNSAGKLLDECKVKNLQYGGAKVWENHANFIINFDDASSQDVLNLMIEMQKRVKEKFDIKLKPEIKYLGGESELWQMLQ